jgi:hypothetical protein
MRTVTHRILPLLSLLVCTSTTRPVGPDTRTVLGRWGHPQIFVTCFDDLAEATHPVSTVPTDADPAADAEAPIATAGTDPAINEPNSSATTPTTRWSA